MPSLSRNISTLRALNAYNIIVCGNYGAGNLGDELILDGLLTLLHGTFPQANVIVLSSDPIHTEKHHRVASLPMLPAGVRSFIKGISTGATSATLEAIKHADLFILGGGGLFTDKNSQAVFIWSTQAKAALKYKIPLWCCGQSIGPIEKSWNRKITQKIFEKAELITVRDKNSQDLLFSWGINQSNLLPDPAFAVSTDYDRKNFSSRSSFDFRTDNEPQKPFIALSLRPWKTKRNLRSLDILSDFILWVWKNYQLMTVLIPFQIHPDNDETVLKQIVQLVHKKGENTIVSLLSYTEDYRKTLDIIRKTQALVGMRLHSLIMSTMLHKPFIGLSYSSKVSNYMNDLGLSEYCMEWEELNLQKLQNSFEDLMHESSSIQKHLSSKQKLWEKQIESYHQLFEQHSSGLKNLKFF